jgi:hypothetical protein
MPLSDYFTLQWYGPACAAARIQCVGTITTAQARGSVRAGATLSGSGTITYARPVRLISAYADLLGQGQITQAQARGRLRAFARIKVNELSQDDVTGAVLEAKVEDNLSLKQAIRLLLAVAQGDGSNLDTNPIFKSLDGTKTRVAGTRSGGTRTITMRDPT